MNKKIVTKSSQETEKLGEEIGKSIQNKAVFALHGELGAGKTTFVKGLAKGLGIKNRIISPTFIIIRTYKISSKIKVRGMRYFYHIDLYRIQDERDLQGLGIKEIIQDPTNIVVMEWAEKAPSLASFIDWDFYFEYTDENQRTISRVKHE